MSIWRTTTLALLSAVAGPAAAGATEAKCTATLTGALTATLPCQAGLLAKAGYFYVQGGKPGEASVRFNAGFAGTPAAGSYDATRLRRFGGEVTDLRDRHHQVRYETRPGKGLAVSVRLDEVQPQPFGPGRARGSVEGDFAQKEGGGRVHLHATFDTGEAQVPREAKHDFLARTPPNASGGMVDLLWNRQPPKDQAYLRFVLTDRGRPLAGSPDIHGRFWLVLARHGGRGLSTRMAFNPDAKGRYLFIEDIEPRTTGVDLSIEDSSGAFRKWSRLGVRPRGGAVETFAVELPR